MANLPNGQHVGIDEDQLKAQHRPKELFSFTGFLARKGGPKSYTKEKRSAYQLNYMAILGGNIFRISAAFLAVFFFLKGVFSITGTAAPYIAGAGAGLLLVSLEIRQWQNATSLLEKWFFKNQLSRPYMTWAVILSCVTLGLSLWGLPHTVAELSPNVNRPDVELLDEDAETAKIKDQIAASEQEAEKFKGTGEWRGRLSASDRKAYNALLLNTKELRDQYTQELKRVRAENRQRIETANLSYMDQVALKMKKDNSYTAYLAIFLLLTEILFWIGFYHKERYEYYAYQEARATGTIAPNSPTPPTGGPRPTQRRPESAPYFAPVTTSDREAPFSNSTANPVRASVALSGNLTGAGSTSDSDFILLRLKRLRGWDDNFGKPGNKPETVAGNITKLLNEIGAEMQRPGFQPGPDAVGQLYQYITAECFPILDANGYEYRYESELKSICLRFLPLAAAA